MHELRVLVASGEMGVKTDLEEARANILADGNVS